jgi:hypothetical protein
VSTAPDLLASLGLGRIITAQPFRRDAQGRYIDAAGARIVFAAAETIRGLQHVLERERPGAWRTTMKSCGHAWGGRIATNLDAQLTAAHQPRLAALPLEACLALLERTFAVHGWGTLKLDVTHAAEHGLLVARVTPVRISYGKYEARIEWTPLGTALVDVAEQMRSASSSAVVSL